MDAPLPTDSDDTPTGPDAARDGARDDLPGDARGGAGEHAGTGEIDVAVGEYPGERLNRILTWVSALVIALSIGGFGGYQIGRGDIPADDSVDVGFARDMIDHHDQANRMAMLLLAADGVDERVRHFAQEVIIEQRFEIGVMTQWLTDWDAALGDPDRVPMLWMSESGSGHNHGGEHDMAEMTVDSMPGMQSEEDMTALRNASGTDAARRFLAMMIDHHQGGIEMADAARSAADQQQVREMADRIVRTQRSEIGEYRRLELALGFPVTK